MYSHILILLSSAGLLICFFSLLIWGCSKTPFDFKMTNVSSTYIETFVFLNVFLKEAETLKQSAVIKDCLSIKHKVINS